MNTDKIYAEKLAGEYAPKNASEIIRLRKLDRKAKQPAKIFTYTFGIAMALIFGLGMCLCMNVIGSGTSGMTVLGIITGMIGFIGVGINYPIYKKILKNSQRKYAFEIVELAKQISDSAE